MSRQRGVTLIEMVIVVALLGLLVGITFPAVTAGIDSLRLSSATDSIVSFLNGAMNRAERRQQVIEVTVAPDENTLSLRSTEAGLERTLEMPDGVEILEVLPPVPMQTAATRRFLFYPGGAVPGFGVELVNRRGVRRIVRVDPVVGAPAVENPAR